MNYVNSFNLLGLEARQRPCLTGNGEPKNTTVGAVGELYIDINTGNIYKCISNIDETYTWNMLCDEIVLKELETIKSALTYVPPRNLFNNKYSETEMVDGFVITYAKGYATGYTINSSGEIIMSDTYKITYLIPIEDGNTLYGYYTNNQTRGYVGFGYFYDAQGEFISKVDIGTNSGGIIPVGAKYVRITNTGGWITNTYATLSYDSTIGVPYSEYHEPFYKIIDDSVRDLLTVGDISIRKEDVNVIENYQRGTSIAESLQSSINYLWSYISKIHAPTVLDSGVCGENLTWTLYSDGLLKISGTGRSYDYCKGTLQGKTREEIEAGVADGTYPAEYAFQEGKTYDDANAQYVSPWYKYRDEVSFTEYGGSYCSKASYDHKNPNGWKYNRIEIDKGITYLGDWLFYRVSGATELIVPEGVTELGSWSIRYSPTLKYIYLPDSLTTIGYRGCSRNEVATSIRLGDNLTSIGSYGLSSNPKVKYLYISAETIGTHMCEGNSSLEYAVLKNTINISENAFTNCSGLKHVEIPNTVTEIGITAFYNSPLDVIKIPSSVATIKSSAFLNNAITDRVLYMDSTASMDIAHLYGTCKYIYLKSGVNASNWMNKNCTKIDENNGYVLYIRNDE